MSKSKIKIKPKLSQWEIIEDDIPMAQDGKKISLDEFRPEFANNNKNIQQEILKNDQIKNSHIYQRQLVLKAINEAEEANREKYEPSQSVKNTKAGLSATQLITPYNAYLNAVNTGGDLYTAMRYAIDGQYDKAKEDLVQAGINWIPFLKGKPGMKQGTYNLSNLDKLINLWISGTQKGSDIKTITEVKQNGGYQWSTQKQEPVKLATPNYSTTKTDGRTKPLSKKELEEFRKHTENLKLQQQQKELAERKARVQQSIQAQNLPLTPQNLAIQTQATGDKLRFFPNAPSDSNLGMIDEYLNPFKMIGDMASGLGSVPYNVQQGNYGQAALAVGMPLGVGALAGIGANSTKQFVNNLANPVAGIDFKQLKHLNVYKHLPEDATATTLGFGNKNPYLHNKKQILLSDAEASINEKLAKGYGINKKGSDLSVQLKRTPPISDAETDFEFLIKENNRKIGTVGLNKRLGTESNFKKGTYYEKDFDFPYMWVDKKEYLGSGISGEVNKAITDYLQENNLGYLYSSLNHTPEGLKRWEKLVKEGKAERVDKNRYKLKQSGGKIKTDPKGYWNKDNVIVKPSNIEGKGLFSNKSLKPNEFIGLAHIDSQPVGDIGNYHNHSEKPNAESILIGNKRFIKPKRKIKKGEEITVDYRLQPELEQPEDFQFDGNSVLEFPIMQQGGVTPKDELIKIDGEWHNQDIIDGLERGYRVEQRRWNSNLNRYGTVNEEEFYKKFPTEEHFILENQRRYANHIGSSRKYVPQDETLMQQGGQVRQPIRGTREQYQAYQDSLDLYNDSEQRTNSALQNANSIANRYNLNRYFWQSPLNVTNEIYPLNYAAESGMSADGNFNYENYWAETENIQNRPNYSRIRSIANRTGYLPRVRRITTTHGNNTSDVHDYVHFYDWQQPVQPIIYTPENERQNPLEQPQIPFPNTTNGQFNRTISKIRPKQTTIQIESKKADLLPSSSLNLEIDPIPFAKGTYFTRERKPQEEGSAQFGRKGKKDYFDKKTGKLLGTYKTGGKVSDWEIIFD